MAGSGRPDQRPVEDPRKIFLADLGGSGPPALLIHGFGADRLSWLANQSEIAKVASLFAVDLPGHGASGDNVGDGSVATLADRVAGVLDEHRLWHVDVIGHSLGGGVAIELAYQRPELVHSLALIAPAGLGGAIDAEFLSAFPQLREPDEAEALLRRMVSRPRLIGRQMVSRVLNDLDGPGKREALSRVAAGAVKAETGLAPAISVIARSDLPRLVIWGDADAIHALDRAKLVAFGGRELIVPGAGHMPHVEAASLVNATIVEFLKSVHHGSEPAGQSQGSVG